MTTLTLKKRTLKLKKKPTLSLKTKSTLSLGKRIDIPTAKKNATGPTLSLKKQKQKKEDSKVEVPTSKKTAKKTEKVESKKSKTKRFLAMIKKESPIWMHCLPLKVGIREEIFEKYGDEYGRKNLRFVLNKHTSRHRYVRKIAYGGNRFDLDGTIVGEVSDKERLNAHEVILDKKIPISLIAYRSFYA